MIVMPLQVEQDLIGVIKVPIGPTDELDRRDDRQRLALPPRRRPASSATSIS